MNKTHITALATVAFAVALCLAVVPDWDGYSAEEGDLTSGERFVTDANTVIDGIVTSADPEHPFLELTMDDDGIDVVVDLFAFQNAEIDINGIIGKIVDAAEGYTITVDGYTIADDGKPDFGNIQAFAYTFVKDAYDNIWNLEATYQQEYLAYDIVIDRNMDGEDLPTTSTEVRLVLRNVNDMAIGFLGDLQGIVDLQYTGMPVVSVNTYNLGGYMSVKDALASVDGFTCDKILGFEYAYMYNMVFGKVIGMTGLMNSVTFTTDIGDDEMVFDLTGYVTETGADNFQKLVNGLVGSMGSDVWDTPVAAFETDVEGIYLAKGTLAFETGYPEYPVISMEMGFQIVDQATVADPLLVNDDGNQVYVLPTLDPECIALGLTVKENYVIDTMTLTYNDGENEVVKNILLTRAFTIPATEWRVDATFRDVTEYTVSYDGNGNTSGTAPQSAVYVNGTDAIVAEAGDLAREGYAFEGWNTAADGSGTSYGVGSTLVVTSDVTLYAQWKPVTDIYDVVIQQNGDGTITADRNEVVAGGSVRITVVADENYMLTDLVIGGNPVGAKVVYTVSNVQSDVVVSAVFTYSEGYVTTVDQSGNVTESYTDGNIHVWKNTATDGTVSATATIGNVRASADSGNVTATVQVISKDTMTDAVSAAKKAATVAGSTATPVIAVTTTDGTAVFGDALQGLKDSGTELLVTGTSVDVRFDGMAVKTLSGLNGDIRMTFIPGKKADLTDKQAGTIGENAFYELGITINGQPLPDFGGKAHVTMDYVKKDPAMDVVVYFVDDLGIKAMMDSKYQNGKIDMTLPHFSVYMIAEETPGAASEVVEDNTQWIILGAVIAIVIVIAAVTYYYTRKG
ncbi:MAG: InlB B-repeat-containing protein [Candidatus Methanomethylophilaceae archaeon]|nr:InlB B-repeat-containing protein [Candidatus Methanomethylophilaceae archaeon]